MCADHGRKGGFDEHRRLSSNVHLRPLANRECLKAMQAGGSISGASVGRIAHILSAEKLWLERLQNQKQSLPVWPGSTVAECAALADEMALAWRDFWRSSGLAASMRRSNTATARATRGPAAWKMYSCTCSCTPLTPGQIAIEMRAAGLEPAYTDFIHAVRQGLWSKVFCST